MPKVLPRETLLNHKMSKAYTEFVKKNHVAKDLKVTGRKELFLIVKTLFKHIGKNLVERTGGVMISNWGYFFNWKIPRKMAYQQKTRGQKIVEKFNVNSDHYMYSPVFMSSGGNHNMRGWLMDNKFCKKIKLGINKKIDSGFKYKMYPHSLRKLLHR